MRRRATLLAPPTAIAVVLALAAPDPPPSQEPPTNGSQEPEQEPLPPGWRGERLEKERELRSNLIGHWQLTDFRSLTSDVSDLQITGFLTIDPEVLVFLVHIVPPTGPPFIDPRQFQGGAHYWRLDDNFRLQTATILAHSNLSGELEFERRLTPREYAIELIDTDLVLRRPDGAELHFVKAPMLHFPEEADEIIEQVRSGVDPFQEER